jgi:hypothetical protein
MGGLDTLAGWLGGALELSLAVPQADIHYTACPERNRDGLV